MPTRFAFQTADGAAYAVNNPVRIGRGPDCHIVLADQAVSRLHATAWVDGGRLFLRDERASNGTFVNGQRLAPGQPVELKPGDQVQLGSAFIFASLADELIRFVPPAAPLPGGPPPAPTVQLPRPAAPARRRSWLPLLLALGALGLLLACAAAAVGLVATGLVPLSFDPARAPSPSATPPAAGATPTPDPAAILQDTPGAVAGGEVPLTPEAVVPAPGPLALEPFAENAAALSSAIAALNTAELRFVEAAAAGAEAGQLDAHLQSVSAEAMRVGSLAQGLGEAAAAQPEGGDGALLTAGGYFGVARLAYALVVEAANAREALARGELAPGQAAHVVAEYGLRLWQPGFDAPPPEPSETSAPSSQAGRVAHSPFLAYTLAPVSVPAAVFLTPEDAERVLAAGLADQAELHAWLAVSSETLTKTLSVPARGAPPPDPFAAELVTRLFDPAGHAAIEGLYLGRAVAAAHLAVLTGGGQDGQSAAPGVPARPAAWQAPGAATLSVPLYSRAVAGAPGAANAALPSVPGGRIQPIFKSPITIIASPHDISHNNIPQVIAHEPLANPSYMMRLRFDAVAAGGGQNRITGPNEDGLVLKLAWEPAPNAINVATRRPQLTLVCRASGNRLVTKAVFGSSGTDAVAFVVPVGVPHLVSCLLLLADPNAPAGQVSGMVVAQSDLLSVTVPGIGPDADRDNVGDALDQCPDQPEDHDKVADSDGCPETDADGDGVEDLPDACPEAAGPAPHGCPEADADADGVPDYKDGCPGAPEDKDEVADHDGCPETDADGDGLPDTADKCPESAEDKDGFQDEDGCFEDDNDQDKLPDVEDACPNEPETVNGFHDDDGCADAWPVINLTGTIKESAADKYGNPFGFTTRFNLTIDYGQGTLAGTLTSTGAAKIQFTCYNVNNSSEIYDTAEASYSLSYTAPATGAGFKPGSLIDVPIAPAGSVSASVSRPFTHEQCTHLNDDPIEGLGPFTGAGRLTILVDDWAYGTVALTWDTPGFGSTGLWTGRGTVR